MDDALTQRMRLEREGVTFDARGRVHLARHLFQARGAADPGPARRRKNRLVTRKGVT
jgi:hypothetical protein